MSRPPQDRGEVMAGKVEFSGLAFSPLARSTWLQIKEGPRFVGRIWDILI